MGFFRRLYRLWRGFIGLFVGVIEKQNPKALLDAHVQDFQTNLAQFNTNLAKQKAHALRIAAALKADKSKESQLVLRIKALMKVGGKEALAGQLAAQRKALKTSIARNEAMLAEANQTYETLTNQRNTFQKTTRNNIERIKGQISEAQMAEAQAKLSEMSSELTFNPDGQGLSDLAESLTERITEAQGRTEVAASANESNTFIFSQVEHELMEQNALSEFAAEMGMAEPTAEPTAEPMSALDVLLGAEGVSGNGVPQEVVASKTL